MISIELARALRTAGLAWEPAAGDRFVIDRPELESQPFVLSDLVADVHEVGGGRVIGFNGTVEWALDSVLLEQTVWLPAEHQLRDRLGAVFTRLERTATGWTVVLCVDGDERTFAHREPAEAYGRALLHLLAEQS